MTRNIGNFSTLSANVPRRAHYYLDTELLTITRMMGVSSVVRATELAEETGTLLDSEKTARFKKNIVATLKFTEMPDRHERIPEEAQKTFSWIFGSPQEHPGNADWDDFTDWLEGDDKSPVYWITGMLKHSTPLTHRVHRTQLRQTWFREKYTDEVSLP
jgi:hypothetical protein